MIDCLVLKKSRGFWKLMVTDENIRWGSLKVKWNQEPNISKQSVWQRWWYFTLNQTGWRTSRTLKMTAPWEPPLNGWSAPRFFIPPSVLLSPFSPVPPCSPSLFSDAHIFSTFLPTRCSGGEIPWRCRSISNDFLFSWAMKGTHAPSLPGSPQPLLSVQTPSSIPQCISLKF